jgi:hypothetical protein
MKWEADRKRMLDAARKVANQIARNPDDVSAAMRIFEIGYEYALVEMTQKVWRRGLFEGAAITVIVVGLFGFVAEYVR